MKIKPLFFSSSQGEEKQWETLSINKGGRDHAEFKCKGLIETSEGTEGAKEEIDLQKATNKEGRREMPLRQLFSYIYTAQNNTNRSVLCILPAIRHYNIF